MQHAAARDLDIAAQRHIPFSVIVPAHDEAALIARCLRAICEGAPAGCDLDLIVIANGCSDQTAEAARKAAPQATVIELAQASKSAAINRGLAVARHVPVLVVDADILCSFRSLAAVSQALAEPEVLAASPAVRVDTDYSSGWVRAYYRLWQQLPYVTDRLIGGGVYGLSRDGLQRIGSLPSIIGDDLFVRTRFAPEERRSVARDAQGLPVYATIIAPRTALDLIRIEARRMRGKRQVDRSYPTPYSGTINGAGALRAALRRGASWSDVVIYVATKLLARAHHAWLTATGQNRWSRDLSSRQESRQAAQ